MSEHLTVVEVKIRVNINSDRPLTEEEVHEMLAEASYAVSYTHLTLPTICSV